jgi:hypothetical protein
MISNCFHRPDEISATEISLGRQRREGRRNVFSYSLPLILQKYRRTGKTAKNKRALFLKIVKPWRSLRLCGE